MSKILPFVCMAIPTLATAQNANVVSAYNYMTDGDLAKAVEYIEPAVGNESTMLKEKTWRYRGDIYRLIAMGDKPELKDKFPDAMDKAVESYLKARELDTKGTYKDDIILNLAGLQGASLNAGNDAFVAKDYDGAIRNYARSEMISKAFGQLDSNAVFNSALAYEVKGDLTNALARYKECVDMGYVKPEVVRNLASLQKRNGDLEAAIATVDMGAKRYPAEKEIMLDRVAYLMEAGRSAEVEASVLKAIEVDPTNAVLFNVLGSIYDAKANPKDGVAPGEKEMLSFYDQAERAYLKAIELDPKNFDANYNVGVLYNNRAAFEYEKIKVIKDDKSYMEKKKVADAVYLRAIPYFERAHELDPVDRTTMQQLSKLYAKTGDETKFAAMKAKLGP
jgi:tetratricopeptide (TPR) repeat protein